MTSRHRDQPDIHWHSLHCYLCFAVAVGHRRLEVVVVDNMVVVVGSRPVVVDSTGWTESVGSILLGVVAGSSLRWFPFVVFSLCGFVK